MSHNRTVIAIVVAVLLLAKLQVGDALTFDLPAQQSKCFTEELPAGFRLRVAYTISGGYGQFVDFKMSEPQGNVVQQSLSTDKGSYDLSTNDIGGEYTFCFYNRLAPGVRLAPSMKRVVDATFLFSSDLNTHDSALRKGHLRPVESNLRLSLDLLKQVQMDYSYMKNREIEMRDTNESTNERTVWARVATVLVGAVVWFLQARHLRSYFHKRKLI